jgi:serine/threonine protein kinase
LKGANVLVNDKGHIKISDFGCARVIDKSGKLENIITRIQGSLMWMAPEALNNEFTRKSDIWSVGCIAIEMAIGGGNPWRDKFKGK